MTKTVLLKGQGIQKEALVKATKSVTPGHLVERTSDGTVQPHSAAAGNAARLFAVENELAGKTISDAYVAGEQCMFKAVEVGAEVYALIPAAAAAIVIGDYLESNGDGTLRKVAADPSVADTVAVGDISSKRAGVIAQALEAIDNSGGGAAVRLKVEVL